jgi:hypothetical protein
MPGTIINPNSCGQGYCPDHTCNPNHSVLTAAGWTYSHTTTIHQGDGSSYLTHTYVCPVDDQWRARVNDTPGNPVDVGRLGSGLKTRFYTHSLRRYLRRKNAELRRKTK